eukprot:scaffold59928_cov20-Tisochrysis_lutea.AAC.1
MQGGHREDFAWHAKALALLRWTRWACCKDLQEIRKQKISILHNFFITRASAPPTTFDTIASTIDGVGNGNRAIALVIMERLLFLDHCSFSWRRKGGGVHVAEGCFTSAKGLRKVALMMCHIYQQEGGAVT